MGKKRKHNKIEDVPEAKPEPKVEAIRTSDEPAPKKPKWTNKTRVLIFSSRGISYRDRHLMNDLRTLMPHAKSDTKMDKKDKLFVINEVCEMKNCQKCIFFEAKKKKDLYMWVSSVPKGPSAKFLVENVHTLQELKMTGNCLKGSRPVLSFSTEFESEPHLALLKEMFVQVFGTPNHHPKSQPFVDHVLSFGWVDNRIWFRNYQILEGGGELVEVGPRMVLNPIRIFEGSFIGITLYQNPSFVSPNEIRRRLRMGQGYKYAARVATREGAKSRKIKETFQKDMTDLLFQTE